MDTTQSNPSIITSWIHYPMAATSKSMANGSNYGICVFNLNSNILHGASFTVVSPQGKIWFGKEFYVNLLVPSVKTNWRMTDIFFGCSQAINSWSYSGLWNVIQQKVLHAEGLQELLFDLILSLSHEICSKFTSTLWKIWDNDEIPVSFAVSLAGWKLEVLQSSNLNQHLQQIFVGPNRHRGG